MASEIRANKQTNRVGLGTVTYTDTGIIVSGIVTANSLGGIGHIDVGSNIKLGNAGVITATSFIGDGSSLTGIAADKIFEGNTEVETIDLGSSGYIKLTTEGVERIRIDSSGHILPAADSTYNIGSNSVRFANGYFDTLYGSGANLTNLPPSAPVGGASTNTVFFENAKEVAVNYQITSTKNAMSAGPIAINAGIAVTVPSGCSWTIV